MNDLEHKLLKKAAKGDILAFEKIITQYEKLIYNLAYRKMSNEEDAKDMAQEAIIKIYKNITKCEDFTNFKSWVCTITINTCIDELRKRKNKLTESIDEMLTTENGEFEKQLKSSDLTPEESLIHSEMNDEIQSAIQKLSENHKNLIILRDIHGFTYQEIANITGDNLGTIKSRMARARENLKKQLQNFKRKKSDEKPSKKIRKED